MVVLLILVLLVVVKISLVYFQSEMPYSIHHTCCDFKVSFTSDTNSFHIFNKYLFIFSNSSVTQCPTYILTSQMSNDLDMQFVQ